MSMCGSCPLYWDEDDSENRRFGITCEGNTDRETCVYNLLELINELERPKGEWKFEGGYFKCSNCGELSFDDEVGSVGFDYKFCPHCGAEMKGEENG